MEVKMKKIAFDIKKKFDSGKMSDINSLVTSGYVTKSKSGEYYWNNKAKKLFQKLSWSY